MKNFIQIITLCFSFLVFGQENIIAVPTRSEDFVETNQDNSQRERIVSFNADIDIAENADVTVTEIIKVFATGNDIKRGIFRALPTVRNINGGKVPITYEIISVEKDGISESFHKETQNGVFNLYIGNKDIQLNSGFYTYKIVYKTQDQIGHFKGYDEFYWNVNGTDWAFPVENIQAVIHLPKGAGILQNSCYTGNHGSTEKNCISEKLSSTEITFKANNLESRENLTVAVGFKPDVLKEPSAFNKWLKKNKTSFPIFAVGFLLLLFYYYSWNKHGRDPEKPTVVPQYNPPVSLSPAALGYIDKAEFELSQTTANLIDLAVKGFVDIDEIKTEKQLFGFSKVFDIKMLNRDSGSLPEDQNILLKKMFGKNKKVSIAGNYSPRLKRAISDSQENIAAKNSVYVETVSNAKTVYKCLKIILIAFFVLLIISALVTESYKALIMAMPLVLFNGLFLALLNYLWKDKSKKLFWIILIFTAPFFIPIFFIAFSASDDISYFESNCYKFLIFGVISLLPFQYFMKRPSVERLDMKAQIDGFKMYLGTAEENQLQFHNPPEMTTDLYEKFLPYAIVFDVDGIWGKKMRNKLKETLNAEDPEMIQQQHFNYSFASSFSQSLAATSVEPPRSFSSDTSSSSSGSSSSSRSSSSSSYSGGSSSSGSSGGGSSGGGGGGGGGGGW
ncbi:DUF2207 domain-containing protein [Chryseobacterium formosus]|uniref:DUF2207 domain-containing protein n=1 Tax=Chryseobacterium formosus TaxID=1537363 RepID=A0ABT3XPQ0_9FLAO|nr:DUF2207 domain-containing protein [Chryseobacterium formosus]MCX8524106.1 DUF2207 domain-containing protein [Chryseobacterium formosus]